MLCAQENRQTEMVAQTCWRSRPVPAVSPTMKSSSNLYRSTKMNKAVFNMEPFSCPSCIKKIESTLKKIDGVDEVKVLFNAGRVRVGFDDSMTNAGFLEDTLTRLGYPVLSTKVT